MLNHQLAMPFMFAQGQLAGIELLLAAGSVFLLVAVVVFSLAVAFPSVVTLLVTRPGGRFWRLPWLWPAPSALALALCLFTAKTDIEGLRGPVGWLLFGALVACALGAVVAIGHLLIRFGRFAAKPSREMVGVANYFYALMSFLGAAGIGVTALLTGTWALLLFSFLLITLGVTSFRLPKRTQALWWPRSGGTRAVWLVGAMTSAFATVLVVGAIMEIVAQFGGDTLLGITSLVVAGVLAAFGLALVVVGERSAKKRLVPETF